MDTSLYIASVHAPTLVCSRDAKVQFYADLRRSLSKASEDDCVVVLGDFSAQVGSNHTTWPFALDKFGCWNINSTHELLHSL